MSKPAVKKEDKKVEKKEAKPATKTPTKAPAAAPAKPVAKPAAKVEKKPEVKAAPKPSAAKVEKKVTAKKDGKVVAKPAAKTAGKIEKKPMATKDGKVAPKAAAKAGGKTATNGGEKKGKGGAVVKKSRKTPADLPAGVAKATEGVKEKKAPRRRVEAVKRSRSFHIGGNLPPKRDLSRMVRWPAYIKLQRKKKIMYERLKIPAMINQFTNVLDKSNAKQIFQMVKKYRPETPHQKKKRLVRLAIAKKAKKTISLTKPTVVKFGVNHVTTLIEQKKAKLVIIANDVDPIETVLWMPTLCRKLDIPYCIVKNKGRLGAAVHLKTASCIAFTGVRQDDKKAFSNLMSMCKSNYNEKADQIVKAVGGGKLGLRSSIALKKRADNLKKASLEKHL